MADIVQLKTVKKKKKIDQDDFYFETVVHYKPVRRRHYVITLNKRQVKKVCDEIIEDGDTSAWKDSDYIAEYLRNKPEAFESATMTEESEIMWEEYEIRVDPESITL